MINTHTTGGYRAFSYCLFAKYVEENPIPVSVWLPWCCQSPHGRHSNTLFACLIYDVANGSTLSQTIWWWSGGVRGPLRWSCKPTTGIHHAYTSYNALGGACTWTTSFDPGPCYCPWPMHPSGGSPAWPKFNACKQVTQRPLVGWVDTFHGGLGYRQAVSRLKAQRLDCMLPGVQVTTGLGFFCIQII